MNQSSAERKGNREVRVSVGNRNLVVKEVNLLRSVQSTAIRSSLGLGSTPNKIFSPSFLGKIFYMSATRRKTIFHFHRLYGKWSVEKPRERYRSEGIFTCILRPSHRLSEIHLSVAVPILVLQQVM